MHTMLWSVEQLSIYLTLCCNNVLSEHFIGLLPSNKIVVSSFTAPNIMKLLKNVFNEKKAPPSGEHDLLLVITLILILGKKRGLKRLLEDEVPIVTWVACENHKIAFSYNHMLPKFICVF